MMICKNRINEKSNFNISSINVTFIYKFLIHAFRVHAVTSLTFFGGATPLNVSHLPWESAIRIIIPSNNTGINPSGNFSFFHSNDAKSKSFTLLLFLYLYMIYSIFFFLIYIRLCEKIGLLLVER